MGFKLCPYLIYFDLICFLDLFPAGSCDVPRLDTHRRRQGHGYPHRHWVSQREGGRQGGRTGGRKGGREGESERERLPLSPPGVHSRTLAHSFTHSLWPTHSLIRTLQPNHSLTHSCPLTHSLTHAHSLTPALQPTHSLTPIARNQLQGYLAHKKHPPPRTPQQDYT